MGLLIMMRKGIFPVSTRYDEKKKKWMKAPAVPKGSSWADFQGKESDLAEWKNVGCIIPTGRLGIDLDTYKGVTREKIESALKCSLDWDGAFIQTTVSGGEHYIFIMPDGAQVHQSSDILGIAGFDTRTANKGWLCTGDGYTDHTLVGLPHAMYVEDFPLIPQSAIDIINGDSGIVDFDYVDDRDDMLSLEMAVNNLPLDDVDLDIAKVYLEKLPESDLSNYDSWVKVGMALHHQFGGDGAALELWKEWSKKAGDDYDENEILDKWPTFAKRDHITKPARFDYIISRAGGRSVEQVKKAQSLIERASQINDHDSYEAIKKEIVDIPNVSLAEDGRQMVAKALYDNYAKEAGITLTAVRSALKSKNKTSMATNESVRGVFKDWVYVETLCEFRHTELYYGIKQEAFNAKFNREPSVRSAEKTASSYALIDCNMPTVVDTMFWPGANQVFEYEGKSMLNTYRECSIKPDDVLSEKGKLAIESFLNHLSFAVEDKREQEIILDWITYVYQNPGKRVKWALLLQGSQGTGKSYFGNVMQAIMGNMVTNLDPSAISGRFTGWAHGALAVVVEEIRIVGTNKFEVVDRIKPFITNETIQIEEKGRDHRTVPNFQSYMMFTNHKDAIPLMSGDRRYCVIFGRIQSEEQLFKELGGEKGAEEYFDNLFKGLYENTGAFARFFTDRRVSDSFKPNGRAPTTRAKEMMMNLSVSPERMEIEDAINRCDCHVINDDILDVTWLNELCKLEGIDIPKTRTLTAVLLDMGYQQIENKRVKIAKTGRYHYIWHKGVIDSKTARDRAREFHDDPDFVPF